MKKVSAYMVQKPQAVARALNRGVLRIRNDIVTHMKKTPRKVFGPNLAPPTEGLDGEDGPTYSGKKRRVGRKLLKKGGSKPHVNNRGGVLHIPSMPGFAPAIDSARLVNSLRLDFVNAKTPPRLQVAELSTAVKYAHVQEFGLKPLGRRNRRPSWRPAFNRQVGRIRMEVRLAFKGGGVY